MKIAFLSDAHGNSLSLSLCLNKLKDLKIDDLYFLGDAVGYLPEEIEVLNLLEKNNFKCIQGNHEAMLVGKIPCDPSKNKLYRLDQAKERLDPKLLDRISSWPDHRVLEIQGKKLLMIHGSPEKYQEGYIYPDSDLSSFHQLPYDAILMGNTHRSFIKEQNNRWIVNVGSCGLPRDQADSLSFAIMNVETFEFEICRVPVSTEKLFDRFKNLPAEDLNKFFRWKK